MNRILGVLSIFCLLGLLSPAKAQMNPEDSVVTLNVTPQQIDVGTFYSGASVQVSAEINSCEGAAIVLEADAAEVALNRKGRVAGIWLNVAKVTVSDAPSVYFLATSDKLDKICSPLEQERLRLGTRFLQRQTRISSEEELSGSEFDEFLKLKHHNGTYNTDLKIELAASSPGMQKLTTTIPIPATVPPGTYTIMMYAFSDGQPVQSGMAKIKIKRVGLAYMMANLAQNHGAEYGVLAIVVAMLVGILMGVIFHSLPKSGH
jgi:uncharacterized protein (TIGR02186 family)